MSDLIHDHFDLGLLVFSLIGVGLTVYCILMDNPNPPDDME